MYTNGRHYTISQFGSHDPYRVFVSKGGHRFTLYITRGVPHVHHVGSRKLLPYKGFGFLSGVYKTSDFTTWIHLLIYFPVLFSAFPN